MSLASNLERRDGTSSPPRKLPRNDDNVPPPGSEWQHEHADALSTMIAEQIPRFRSRPYLGCCEDLAAALRKNLEAHLQGDFCWSLNFAPRFVAALCAEGFLPICCELGGGTGLYVLLPKLHTERCVLPLDRLHVSRKTRRRARGFTLTCSTAFGAVIDGCLEQHGESWLYPPLRHTFAALAAKGLPPAPPELAAAGAAEDVEKAGDDAAAPERGGGSAGEQKNAAASAAADADAALPPPPSPSAAPATPPPPSPPPSPPPPGGAAAGGASMVSFELWQDGKLVAGEFGSMTGCSYTSFSGFHRVDSAGSVQMAMTARLLQRAGFDFWDMGQEHAYKLRVGAAMEPRDAFLRRFRDARARPSRLAALAARGGGRFGAELLGGDA